MPRNNRGESDKARSTRQRLEQKHGLKIGGRARADDEGLDERARKGLAKENGRAFGISHARGAIRDRVKGDLLGRKNT